MHSKYLAVVLLFCISQYITEFMMILTEVSVRNLQIQLQIQELKVQWTDESLALDGNIPL